MGLRYYIIPDALALQLGLRGYRMGNSADGWLVHIGDLAAYGPERAVQDGAREISREEARRFANTHRYNR